MSIYDDYSNPYASSGATVDYNAPQTAGYSSQSGSPTNPPPTYYQAPSASAPPSGGIAGMSPSWIPHCRKRGAAHIRPSAPLSIMRMSCWRIVPPKPGTRQSAARRRVPNRSALDCDSYVRKIAPAGEP